MKASLWFDVKHEAMAPATADDSLALRIIQDLDAAFRNTPRIEEFDIIPTAADSVRNKSPVVLIDDKLALESWCVSHVYLYAYQQTMRNRPTSAVESGLLLSWTRVILLVNPDVATAWNIRKEMVVAGKLDTVEDLRFSELVLTRKPKSLEVFSHRKWLLERLKKTDDVSFKTFLKHEVGVVCTKAVARHPRNYNAWNHRIWLMNTFEDQDILREELLITETWIQTHVSDYSGFHYRQFLFEALKKWQHLSSQDHEGMLKKELETLSALMLQYPCHESLWCHRRYVLREMHESQPDAKLADSKQEASFLESFAKNSASQPEACMWQDVLLSRHLAWLRNVLRWHVAFQKSQENQSS